MHTQHRTLSAQTAASFNQTLLSKLSDKSLLKNKLYVNGAWNDGEGGSIAVHSPTTGQLIAHIPTISQQGLQDTLKASTDAFQQWSAALPSQRAAVLSKWRELMMAHQKDLATILSFEQGKPLAEAMGEIAYAASFFHVYAGEAERIMGEYLPPHASTSRVIVMKSPVGVVGSITPWNFPSAMITRKCGAALAAGCTVILKPSELTPFSALALAELGERAGLPKGCMNIVFGNAAEIGEFMCSEQHIKKITFTGSTRVGKILIRQSADKVKRMSMELGGNAPFIIFGDADINAALQGVQMAKFRNMGQTCVTANRVYIHSSIYDQVVDKLKGIISNLKVGNGLDEGVQVGPLINEAAVKKVEQHVNDAVSKGAKVMTGGARWQHGRQDLTNLFYQPTLIANAKPDMMVCQDETFGPVLFAFKFDSEEEVIQQANNTTAGLASYFYTKDISRIFRMCDKLQYGMIGVNSGTVSAATAPFGGVKESGFGREGSHHGLTDYLDIKAVHLGI